MSHIDSERAHVLIHINAAILQLYALFEEDISTLSENLRSSLICKEDIFTLSENLRSPLRLQR